MLRQKSVIFQSAVRTTWSKADRGANVTLRQVSMCFWCGRRIKPIRQLSFNSEQPAGKKRETIRDQSCSESRAFLKVGAQLVDKSVTPYDESSWNQAAALNAQAQLSWEWISGWECGAALCIQEQPPTRIYHLRSSRQYLENHIGTTAGYVSRRSEPPKIEMNASFVWAISAGAEARHPLEAMQIGCYAPFAPDCLPL